MGETMASVRFIILTVILITIVVGTIVGNFFVIVAILIDKNLQTTANQLVLSLAVADLMVACLVMPLGAYNDIYQGWYLSKEVCEFWTSADVLCCTASILNLLAIAIDRYWAVTNVDYIYRRTKQRVNIMILCAWTVGAIVSLAPIFGWKDPDFAKRVLDEHKCMVSQDVAYQIFATISTFYAPLVLLLALYWRIFQVARKRIRRKPGRQAILSSGDSIKHQAKQSNLQAISVVEAGSVYEDCHHHRLQQCYSHHNDKSNHKQIVHDNNSNNNNNNNNNDDNNINIISNISANNSIIKSQQKKATMPVVANLADVEARIKDAMEPPSDSLKAICGLNEKTLDENGLSRLSDKRATRADSSGENCVDDGGGGDGDDGFSETDPQTNRDCDVAPTPKVASKTTLATIDHEGAANSSKSSLKLKKDNKGNGYSLGGGAIAVAETGGGRTKVLQKTSPLLGGENGSIISRNNRFQGSEEIKEEAICSVKKLALHLETTDQNDLITKHSKSIKAKTQNRLFMIFKLSQRKQRNSLKESLSRFSINSKVAEIETLGTQRSLYSNNNGRQSSNIVVELASKSKRKTCLCDDDIEVAPEKACQYHREKSISSTCADHRAKVWPFIGREQDDKFNCNCDRDNDNCGHAKHKRPLERLDNNKNNELAPDCSTHKKNKKKKKKKDGGGSGSGEQLRKLARRTFECESKRSSAAATIVQQPAADSGNGDSLAYSQGYLPTCGAWQKAKTHTAGIGPNDRGQSLSQQQQQQERDPLGPSGTSGSPTNLRLNLGMIERTSEHYETSIKRDIVVDIRESKEAPTEPPSCRGTASVGVGGGGFSEAKSDRVVAAVSQRRMNATSGLRGAPKLEDEEEEELGECSVGGCGDCVDKVEQVDNCCCCLLYENQITSYHTRTDDDLQGGQLVSLCDSSQCGGGDDDDGDEHSFDKQDDYGRVDDCASSIIIEAMTTTTECISDKTPASSNDDEMASLNLNLAPAGIVHNKTPVSVSIVTEAIEAEAAACVTRTAALTMNTSALKINDNDEATRFCETHHMRHLHQCDESLLLKRQRPSHDQLLAVGFSCCPDAQETGNKAIIIDDNNNNNKEQRRENRSHREEEKVKAPKCEDADNENDGTQINHGIAATSSIDDCQAVARHSCNAATAAKNAALKQTESEEGKEEEEEEEGKKKGQKGTVEESERIKKQAGVANFSCCFTNSASLPTTTKLAEPRMRFVETRGARNKNMAKCKTKDKDLVETTKEKKEALLELAGDGAPMSNRPPVLVSGDEKQLQSNVNSQENVFIGNLKVTQALNNNKGEQQDCLAKRRSQQQQQRHHHHHHHHQQQPLQVNNLVCLHHHGAEERDTRGKNKDIKVASAEAMTKLPTHRHTHTCHLSTSSTVNHRVSSLHQHRPDCTFAQRDQRMPHYQQRQEKQSSITSKVLSATSNDSLTSNSSAGSLTNSALSPLTGSTDSTSSSMSSSSSLSEHMIEMRDSDLRMRSFKEEGSSSIAMNQCECNKNNIDDDDDDDEQDEPSLSAAFPPPIELLSGVKTFKQSTSREGQNYQLPSSGTGVSGSGNFNILGSTPNTTLHDEVGDQGRGHHRSAAGYGGHEELKNELRLSSMASTAVVIDDKELDCDEGTRGGKQQQQHDDHHHQPLIQWADFHPHKCPSGQQKRQSLLFQHNPIEKEEKDDNGAQNDKTHNWTSRPKYGQTIEPVCSASYFSGKSRNKLSSEPRRMYTNDENNNNLMLVQKPDIGNEAKYSKQHSKLASCYVNSTDYERSKNQATRQTIKSSTSSSLSSTSMTQTTMPQQTELDREKRLLDLRRKFRAMGQLVSFIQTSGNFHQQYSDAPTTSQSGDEADNSNSSALRRSNNINNNNNNNFSQGKRATSNILDTRGQQQGKSIVSKTPLQLSIFGLQNQTKLAHTNLNVKGIESSEDQQLRPRSESDLEAATRATSSISIQTNDNQDVANLRLARGQEQKQRPYNRPNSKRLSTRRDNMDIKREKKAAKTLAIITGVFVVCWLPFFLNAIIMPICGQSCTPSDLILSVLLWLGYLNSLLNPIIYTIFSPDFRRAFRRLLCWPQLIQLTSNFHRSTSTMKA